MSKESEHPELLDWHKEILGQRLLDAETNPEDWVSWEEAKQRLERQLRGHRCSSASTPSPRP